MSCEELESGKLECSLTRGERGACCNSLSDGSSGGGQEFFFGDVENLSRLNVGVAAIQETWWFGSDCYTIKGYLVLSSGRAIPAEGESFRRGEGLAVILNKYCQEAWRAGGWLWKSYSSRLMSVRLKFSNKERFRVFSAYAPTFSSPRNIKEEFTKLFRLH